MMDKQDLRERAIANLKKKRDLAAHLLALLVNVSLVAIWAITGDGTLFWPIFPILGWGIGLAFHAWDVYGRPPGGREADPPRDGTTSLTSHGAVERVLRSDPEHGEASPLVGPPRTTSRSGRHRLRDDRSESCGVGAGRIGQVDLVTLPAGAVASLGDEEVDPSISAPRAILTSVEDLRRQAFQKRSNRSPGRPGAAAASFVETVTK